MWLHAHAKAEGAGAQGEAVKVGLISIQRFIVLIEKCMYYTGVWYTVF